MGTVTLVPMSEEVFAGFVESSIVSYAAEHVKSGRWTQEESLEKSRQEFNELLPNGIQSDKQHLFSIQNEVGENVGRIWLAEKNATDGWIYDVEIDEQFRRRGYAQAAFAEIEKYGKSLGLKKIGLHVFGHNHGAVALYQKLGYETTNVIMSKGLE